MYTNIKRLTRKVTTVKCIDHEKKRTIKCMQSSHLNANLYYKVCKEKHNHIKSITFPYCDFECKIGRFFFYFVSKT